MSAHPFARAAVGIALVEENIFLRQSLINLIFVHRIQLIGQQILFFF